MPPEGSGASAAASTLNHVIDISFGVEDEVILILETRLSDSLATLTEHQCPSESIVVSPDQSNDGEGPSTQKGQKRTATNTTTSFALKKKKVAPSMITRRWQVV